MDSKSSTTGFSAGRNASCRQLWIGLFGVLHILCLDAQVQGDDWATVPTPPGAIVSPDLAENADPGLSVTTENGTSDVFRESLQVPDAFEPPPEPCFDPHHWRTTDKPLFRLRGRIDTDLVLVNQSAANQAAFGNLQDVIGLRRARVGASGNLTPDLRYLAEIDMASSTVAIRDLFVGWGDVQDFGEFRIGHLREPFSLEGGTSANSYTFLERSPTNNLDPARNWGLGYFRCSPGEDSTLAVGVFHSGSGPTDSRGGLGDNSALTARWTHLPWYADHGQQMMHLGFALSSRIPDRDFVVINQQPQSPLLDLGDSSASPFVPTIRIPARFQQLFNAQWALVNGSFSAQAEWYGSLIDQIGGQTVFYNGSYFNLSYFLTGEHRTYQKQNGVFGAVSVNQPLIRRFSSRQDGVWERGYGAWELTTQLGYLDFSDSDTPQGPLGLIPGIRLPQLTMGVNWYLADRLRIMFNYSHSVPDEPNTGSSSGNLFSSRLAMYW